MKCAIGFNEETIPLIAIGLGRSTSGTQLFSIFQCFAPELFDLLLKAGSSRKTVHGILESL